MFFSASLAPTKFKLWVGAGTLKVKFKSFLIPTIIILCRYCGTPYSSNLYKCGTKLYPVPAFCNSSKIF